MKNYYKILGISNFNATEQDITRAFRILARRYHPDINPNQDATEKFKEINECYKILKDNEKRKKYDLKLKEYISKTYSKNNTEIKKEIFNENKKNSSYIIHSLQKTKNIISKKTVKTNIEIFSKRLKEQLKKYNIFDFSKDKKTLSKNLTTEQLNIIEIILQPKEAIFGTKKNIIIEKKEILITIPPNSFDGKIIKLKSSNNNDELLIITKIEKNNFIQIEKKGLIVNLPISFKESVLGAKIKIQTLDGQCYVTIPPHINSGSELRLQNRGILHLNGSRGDLFLRIQIQSSNFNQDKNFQNAINEIDKYFDYELRNQTIETTIKL